MAYELPNPETNLPAKDEKFPERGTYYFTERQIDAVEDVIYGVRKETGVRAGKSEVVRAAIEFIAEDFRLNGKDSWIARRLAAESAVAVG